jgi:hypothetical protein
LLLVTKDLCLVQRSSPSLKQPWHLCTRQRSFVTSSNLGMLGFQHGNTSLIGVSELNAPESNLWPGHGRFMKIWQERSPSNYIAESVASSFFHSAFNSASRKKPSLQVLERICKSASSFLLRRCRSNAEEHMKCWTLAYRTLPSSFEPLKIPLLIDYYNGVTNLDTTYLIGNYCHPQFSWDTFGSETVFGPPCGDGMDMERERCWATRPRASAEQTNWPKNM